MPRSASDGDDDFSPGRHEENQRTSSLPPSDEPAMTSKKESLQGASVETCVEPQAVSGCVDTQLLHDLMEAQYCGFPCRQVNLQLTQPGSEETKKMLLLQRVSAILPGKGQKCDAKMDVASGGL